MGIVWVVTAAAAARSTARCGACLWRAIRSTSAMPAPAQIARNSGAAREAGGERVGRRAPASRAVLDHAVVDRGDRGHPERSADVAGHVRDARGLTDLFLRDHRGRGRRGRPVGQAEPGREHRQREHEHGVRPRRLDEGQGGESGGRQAEPARDGHARADLDRERGDQRRDGDHRGGGGQRRDAGLERAHAEAGRILEVQAQDVHERVDRAGTIRIARVAPTSTALRRSARSTRGAGTLPSTTTKAMARRR